MATIIRDGYHKMEDVYKDVPRDQWPKATAGVEGGRPEPAGGPVFAAAALLFCGLGVALRLR